MKKLRFCTNCNEYTLELNCSVCNMKSISKYPPKFSPQDKYGKYRRILKKQRSGE